VTAAPGPSGGGPGGKWPNGCVNGGADCTERPSGYLPITRGIRTHVRDVTLLTSVCVNDSKTMNEDGFCQHGSKVTLSVLQIRPGRRNLLRTGIDSGAGRNGVDVAAATVPLDPKSCADAGGWNVTASTQGSAFHSLSTGLPATTSTELHHTDVVQVGLRYSSVGYRMPPVVTRALRLAGGVATDGTLNISMPAVSVSPTNQYVLSGHVRTNGVGRFVVHTVWLDFDGVPSSDSLARTTMEMNCSWLGWHEAQALWEPLLLRLESPGDASMLQLGFSVTGGAVVDLYDLGMY
jgi:hypothetical protein